MSRARTARVVVVPAAAEGTGGGDYALRLAEELGRRPQLEARVAAKGTRADVVVFNHAPYARGVAAGWLTAVVAFERAARGRASVVVLHEVFERPDDSPRMRVLERLQRWSFSRLTRRAGAVVVADTARAQRLARLVPTAREPLVVPVGPNVPVPEHEPARPDSGLIVSFGLMQATRDLEAVVEAMPRVREQRADAKLVLLGDLGTGGVRVSALRDRARRVGGVTITGKLPAGEVARWFGRAAAFVSPYTDAVSFGSGTLATGLAYGLPVVAFASADIHPALLESGAAVLAEREPVALGAALAEALSPASAGRAQAARRLYERELSWQAIGDRFEPVVRRLSEEAA